MFVSVRRFDRGSARLRLASGVLLVGVAIGGGCGPAVAEDNAPGSELSSGEASSSSSTGPGSSASSASEGVTSAGETSVEASTGTAKQGYCVVRAPFSGFEGGDAVPLLADVDGDGVTEVWRLEEVADGTWDLLGFEYQPSGDAAVVQGEVVDGRPTAFADVDGDGHDDAVLYRPSGNAWVSGADTGLVPGSAAPFGDAQTSFLAVGEFDGDGHLDAIGLAGFEDEWILYAGDGAGGLDASDVFPRGSMTPDHTVAGPQDTLWVYTNPVCLGFCPSHVDIVELRWQHPATAIVGTSRLEPEVAFTFVAWVDLDSDGGPELLLLDGGTLLLGSAGAAGGQLDFETLQQGTGRATHGDFDGDGAIDVLTADPDDGMWILWGGDGGVAEAQPLQGTASGALGDVVDLNGDGSGEWLEYDASSPIGSQYAVVDIVPCP